MLTSYVFCKYTSGLLLPSMSQHRLCLAFKMRNRQEHEDDAHDEYGTHRFKSFQYTCCGIMLNKPSQLSY